MPTYRNDGSVTYRVRTSEYVKKSVIPGESVPTLQLLENADFTKTSDSPANPKVWNLELAPGSTYADNIVDLGAIMEAEVGYIKVSASVNMKINSVTGDAIYWDVSKMGYIWNFNYDTEGIRVDKLYFGNPPISGAVTIYVEVYASSR
jgi:hypothetical protein